MLTWDLEVGRDKLSEDFEDLKDVIECRCERKCNPCSTDIQEDGWG